jgi:hypothetical protein
LIIIGTVVLILIGWIVWLFMASPDQFIWYPTFSHENDQPYDFSLVKSSLEASYKDQYEEFQDFSEDTLDSDPSESLFFYLAGNDFLDSLETARIMDFAENGGRVFISSRTQNKILQELFKECIPEIDEVENPRDYDIVKFKKAKRISPRIYGESYDEDFIINWQIRDEESRYDWAYFDLSNCSEDAYSLSGEFVSIGEVYNNLIEVQYGNGLLVFHTNPLIFTNIHFKKKKVFDYTNLILENYNREKLVYYNPKSTRNRVGGGGQSIPESPLKFILNNPPLKWGWYLLLALVILFVLNFWRREERPVPVQQLPENETANYLDVVSKLYQKEGKHKHIVALKERLLLQFLRNRYGLPTGKLDESFVKRASVLLEMEENYVSTFFKDLERAKNNSSLTEAELLKLNSKIKAFYKKCP